MSRLFDGVDDVMNYTIPAGVALNDAFTMLIVCRIVVTADNTWLSLLEGERSTGATGAALGRRNNGTIYFANSASLASAGSITDSDGWMILAVTNSSAAARSVHKLPIGGARTTSALGAIADGLTCAGGTMRIGGNDDFANIRVAAAAIWEGVTLTTGQLDGILAAKTSQSIADLTPTWLVDDSDAFATNLVNPGVMDRASVTGTADDADDPAGWVYGLGGAAAYTLDCQPATFTLTGTAATPVAGRMINAATGSYTVAGAAATTARGLFLTASPGAVTVTGAAATPLADRTLVADAGAYTVAGTDATVGRELSLAASPAAYIVTGTDASPLAGRSITAAPASFILTGVEATLPADRVFNAEPGAYTITGAVAGLDVETPGAFTLNAELGTFTVAAADATAAADRLFNAEPGSVSVTATVATVGRALALAADSGSYTLAGVAVTFTRTLILAANSAAYTVTGADAQLRSEGQETNMDAILTGWIAGPVVGSQGGGATGRIRTPTTGSVA